MTGAKSKRHRRVLIALGWYDYRLHRGIEKYAQEHGWQLSSNFAREKVIPWGWEGDGILAWLGAGDDLAEFVEEAGKPTVDFSFRRPQLSFPRVLEDHAHAANLAAEHFLARGFRQFLFYSAADNWSYEERGNAFVRAIQEAGHDCEWLRWHTSSAYRADREQWRRKQGWLAVQLQRMAQPLGVFAANDDHALEVLDACEECGIAVPESVAIVGAENYLLAPDACPIPLSSVDTNLQALGYRGAQLLDELMNGKPAPTEPIRMPAAGLVLRRSSDLLAVNHKGVAKSLRYIWEHCHEPISVKDLVGVACMSRRGLHKAFSETLGRTPGQELQRMRLERAKQLLTETDQKIEVLAGMCGFRSANTFCVAFKQATGMSPRKFRETYAK